MGYLLNHLIEEAAQRDPAHPAMRCRDQTLSYGDLVERARALSGALVEAGVQPGDRVGILMNKHVDCATALYGIMGAGGVYVPLDPLAPPARLSTIQQDCGLRHIVSEPRKAGLLNELLAMETATPVTTALGAGEVAAPDCRGLSWDQVMDFADRPLTAPALTEDSLAYILYTSGSTGVPKGIAHTHRSALAWAEVTTASYGLMPADRISNYAPLHFDLSTLDYFGGARAGATTVMIPEEYARFPVNLAQLIEDEQLTLFYTVPYALVQLVQAGVLERHRFPRLRQVLFGGEPMPPKHLRVLMDGLTHVDFYNVYGPTETNGCTHHPVKRSELDHDAPLSIGDVYADVEALIVGRDDEPVADGETGELLIHAPTNMQGYWGRPDLHARVFSERAGPAGRTDIFVRTGDLVRRNAQGNLDFLGRKDRLVKTKGYRVELDDVEAALVAHHSVAEAAAFTVPDPTGSVLIRAAVIPVTEKTYDPSAMVRHLRQRLPAYALPAAIDVLADFPRTSTGKIDRLSLQAAAA